MTQASFCIIIGVFLIGVEVILLVVASKFPNFFVGKKLILVVAGHILLLAIGSGFFASGGLTETMTCEYQTREDSLAKFEELKAEMPGAVFKVKVKDIGDYYKMFGYAIIETKKDTIEIGNKTIDGKPLVVYTQYNPNAKAEKRLAEYMGKIEAYNNLATVNNNSEN